MPIRLLAVVLAACLGACSAVHECTDGETSPCGGSLTQTCAAGRGGPCGGPPMFDDGDPHHYPDMGPRPDTSSSELMDASVDASLFDGALVETDTDPYEGDVVSPGACVWSAGPPQALTTGPSGGMQLYRLGLGTTSIHVPWTGIADNVVRAQPIGFDGSPTTVAQPLVPAPTTGSAYGEIAEGAMRRAALVGPTGASIIVPLTAADAPQAPSLPVMAGRCWSFEVDDANGAYAFLYAPGNGSAGVRWLRVDAVSGEQLLNVLVASQQRSAVHSTLHGPGVEGSFLVVAQGDAATSAVTTQRFGADGARLSPVTTLEGTLDTVRLRDAPPVASDGGWLLALDVNVDDTTYAIATVTLDEMGVPTRPRFVVPGVRSARGIASYDLAAAGDDVMLVWTEWIDRSASEIAMHALALSPDGFPRGAVLDLGRFTSAGVASDAIRVARTPLGAVVVYHARDTSLSPDLQLYSRLLTCR